MIALAKELVGVVADAVKSWSAAIRLIVIMAAATVMMLVLNYPK